jgi:predicted O-methyltransferase YrrM
MTENYLLHEECRSTYFKNIPENLSDYWTKKNRDDIAALLPVLYYVGSIEKWKYVLEIGTGFAVSSSALAGAVEQQDGMVITVDVDDQTNAVDLLPNELRKHVIFVKGDSRETENIKKVISSANIEQLDAIFIDGGHDFDTVKQDFYEYKDLVRKGGFILFHDVCLQADSSKCQVYKFWFDLDDPEFEKLTLSASNGLGILRKR